MKKLIITKEQFKRLSEDSTTISVQPKGNTVADIISAVNDPNTQKDIAAAKTAGDVNLQVGNNDDRPNIDVNVAQNQSPSDAITKQANSQLVQNGSPVLIHGDGLGEAKQYTKKQIQENLLRNLVKKNFTVINENRESKNINLARKFLMQQYRYSLEQSQKIIDSIRTDIPNSRLMDCKYLLGVTRLYMHGELNDQRSIADLNKDLKYIASEAHCDEYDNNLNMMNAQAIHDRFKENINNDFFANKEKSDSRSLQANSNYTIVRVPDFETASEYGRYTSWCVTHDEGMYNSYTNEGAGLFYFCLRKDYKQTRKVMGEGCPLDTYGLSMIAVSVDQQGEMNTITCRWNHDNGGNDTVMSVEELENLLGVNFYKTFKPYSKEELIEKGKWISEKIGTLYDDGNIKGIVASVDENDNPHLLIALDRPETYITWDEAMNFGKTLRNGWHIPTKEELEEIWHDNSTITKMINRGLKKFHKSKIPNWIWSSTEYNSRNAYRVYANNGRIIINNKHYSFYVCPVLALS